MINLYLQITFFDNVAINAINHALYKWLI